MKYNNHRWSPILLAIVALPPLTVPVSCQNLTAYSWVGVYAARPTACPDGTLGFATDKPAGQNVYSCKANTWTMVGTGGGPGSVTSVGISLPTSLVSCSGSPVTSAGTITCTFSTGQTANQVLRTGSGAVAFGALTLTDLPGSIPLTQLATQAADTVLLNASGGVAGPTAVSMPTTGTNGCAGASNALIYNTATHMLGCNTISGGSGNLPTSAAQQFYTTDSTNTPVSVAPGPSGALQILANGQPDIVTSVLPRVAAANTFTGTQTMAGIFSTQSVTSATDSTVASATTIAPTTSLAFITGTTPIATITAPTGCTTSGTDCFMTLVSDPSNGPYTMTTAGNIYATYTAVVGQGLRLVYFPATAKWYQIH